MPDPNLSYLKPGYPKKSIDGKSYVTKLQYIGPYDELEAGAPDIGTKAEDYGDVYEGTVTQMNLDPIEGTDPLYGELSVEFERKYEVPETAGKEVNTIPEVEWVSVSRSMFEHPAFRQGGPYALNNQDIINLEFWKNEQDADQKALFNYKASPDSSYNTLSDNAIKFAQGILLQIEYYDEFVPVVRMTTTFVNGGPDSSDAGLRSEPPQFPCKPKGFEWRKSADRAVQSGKQNQYQRYEEWLGAEKVLVDSKNIYY